MYYYIQLDAILCTLSNAPSSYLLDTYDTNTIIPLARLDNLKIIIYASKIKVNLIFHHILGNPKINNLSQKKVIHTNSYELLV